MSACCGTPGIPVGGIVAKSAMPSWSCLRSLGCFGRFGQSPVLPSNATLERMREQREPFSTQPQVILAENLEDTNLSHIFPQSSGSV